MIEEKNDRFACVIPSKKEHILLIELNKTCFIKAVSRRPIKEPINSIYDDKIMFKVVAYCSFLYKVVL